MFERCTELIRNSHRRMPCSKRTLIITSGFILLTIIMLQRMNMKRILGRQQTSPPSISIQGTIFTDVDRYALCFYGLTRSVNWTIDSIEQHIRLPLRDENGTSQFDTFVHTYRLNTLDNPRAGEQGVAYTHLEDIELLEPTRYLITSQDEFDLVNPELEKLTTLRWDTSYEESTVRNILRAQHSMSLVWSIMMDYADEHAINYRGIIFLRPDVLFLRDIDISLQDLKANVVYVPSFGSFGGYNDRFAYGSVPAMRIYANRMSTTLARDVTSRTTFNSERFLAYHLKTNDVSAVKTNMIFARVRSTGSVPRKDLPFVQQACSDGLDIACILINN